MGKLNNTQHLLIKMMEECDEVSQRCSKALTFGVDEVQEGQKLNNHERIALEFADLTNVLNMFMESIGEEIDEEAFNARLEFKRKDVEKWMQHSREQGTLE